ncbi:MAG: glyoxalase [Flavobacteriales bacterium]
MERGRNLIQLRPEIPQADVNETMTEMEQFQNTTLRPILKFQHELLCAHYSQFARGYKKDWGSISNEKKIVFIENSVMNNQALKKTIVGIIMGLFTLEEQQFYLTNKSEINRRIIQMGKQRIISNLASL